VIATVSVSDPASLGWAEADIAPPFPYAEQLKQGLARELHDSVAQTLTTMLIAMEHFKVEQVGRRSVIEQVNALQQDTRAVLTNIRQLLHDLRGEPGVSTGFVEAARELVRRFEERAGIPVRLTVSDDWPSRLRSQAARHLCRILEEALNNILWHSGASAVTVALGTGSGMRLSIEIRDNGRGLATQPGVGDSGMGLLGIRERVTILGGELRIESRVGGGTSLEASLPAAMCA
jgi:signal transduction histidine kinase